MPRPASFPGIVFRPARPDEIPLIGHLRIARLWMTPFDAPVATFPERHDADAVPAVVPRLGRVIVAEVHGQLAGAAGWQPARGRAPRAVDAAEVAVLFLLPELAGADPAALAEALGAAVEAEAAAAGFGLALRYTVQGAEASVEPFGYHVAAATADSRTVTMVKRLSPSGLVPMGSALVGAIPAVSGSPAAPRVDAAA